MDSVREDKLNVDICSICTEQIKTNDIKLKCGHSFHINCISQWGKHNKTDQLRFFELNNTEVISNDCPLCRQNFKIIKYFSTNDTEISKMQELVNTKVEMEIINCIQQTKKITEEEVRKKAEEEAEKRIVELIKIKTKNLDEKLFEKLNQKIEFEFEKAIIKECNKRAFRELEFKKRQQKINDFTEKMRTKKKNIFNYTSTYNLNTPIIFEIVFKKRDISMWEYIQYDTTKKFINDKLVYVLCTDNFILDYNFFSIKFYNLILKKIKKPCYFKIPLDTLYSVEIKPTFYGLLYGTSYDFKLNFENMNIHIKCGTSMETKVVENFFRFFKKRLTYRTECANKIKRYYLNWKKQSYDI